MLLNSDLGIKFENDNNKLSAQVRAGDLICKNNFTSICNFIKNLSFRFLRLKTYALLDVFYTGFYLLFINIILNWEKWISGKCLF